MRRELIGACAAVLLVVGCTSTPDAAPISTSPSPSSEVDQPISATTPTSSSASSTTADTSENPETPVISESSSESPPAQETAPVSQPWPDGLSAEDQIRAQQSIDVLIGYWTVFDAVAQAPEAKDWTEDVYNYATGDLATDTLDYGNTLKVQGSHQVGGNTLRDVYVESITAEDVIVSACVVADSQIVDATGTVAGVLDGGHRQSARIVTRDLKQLVIEMIAPQEAPEC